MPPLCQMGELLAEEPRVAAEKPCTLDRDLSAGTVIASPPKGGGKGVVPVRESSTEQPWTWRQAKPARFRLRSQSSTPSSPPNISIDTIPTTPPTTQLSCSNSSHLKQFPCWAEGNKTTPNSFTHPQQRLRPSKPTQRCPQAAKT